MLQTLKKLLLGEHYPLNQISIDSGKIVSNYKLLSEINPGIGVAPVLKSNAYGHGIEIIGKLIDGLKPPFICVDSLAEAYRLQKAGVKSEILIMGYTDPRNLARKKLPFSYVVFSTEQLAAINEYQPGAKVHLFFDTGMHREGFETKDMNTVMRLIKKFDKVVIDGVMSHLAVSDNPEDPTTLLQINNFKAAKMMVLQSGYKPRWFHMGGSYALLHELSGETNVVRCGKSLYGYPSPAVLPGSKLQPALKLTTRLAQWKYVKKGEMVGYSNGFKAPQDMILGILPIGYNDGVDRRLSNTGTVRVKPAGADAFGEKRNSVYDSLPEIVNCKIVGMVSMNITTIDLTHAQQVLGDKVPAVGDDVEIFSDDPFAENSFENAAKLCNTIPLELLVRLHPSTRRVSH